MTAAERPEHEDQRDQIEANTATSTGAAVTAAAGDVAPEPHNTLCDVTGQRVATFDGKVIFHE